MADEQPWPYLDLSKLVHYYYARWGHPPRTVSQRNTNVWMKYCWKCEIKSMMIRLTDTSLGTLLVTRLTIINNEAQVQVQQNVLDRGKWKQFPEVSTSAGIRVFRCWRGEDFHRFIWRWDHDQWRIRNNKSLLLNHFVCQSRSSPNLFICYNEGWGRGVM